MVRALVMGLVLAVGSSVAIAQQPNPEGAKLFEDGRELAKAGKYAEACDRFARSLEIDPAIGTQLNYADCHEKMGQHVEAWRLFDGAAEAEKITNPQRAKFARERADALLPKLGVVVLRIATPDAPAIAVSIAGRTMKAAPVLTEIVKPGEVTITVTSSGEPFQRTEKVAAGKTITIDVPAFAEPATVGGGTQAVLEPVAGPVDTGGSRRRSRLLLAYGVGGAGGVALLAGVFIGLRAKNNYNEQFDNMNCTETDGSPVCNDTGFSAQSDAVSLANVGTVLGVGGLALIAGGAVLYFTAPESDVVVTPTATAQSAGISVVGRF